MATLNHLKHESWPSVPSLSTYRLHVASGHGGNAEGVCVTDSDRDDDVVRDDVGLPVGENVEVTLGVCDADDVMVAVPLRLVDKVVVALAVDDRETLPVAVVELDRLGDIERDGVDDGLGGISNSQIYPIVDEEPSQSSK